MRPMSVLLCASLLAGSLGCSSAVQLLSVTAVSPTTITVSTSPTTLTVTGTQFNGNITVVLGSLALPTTFVSATTLTAIVPAGIAAGTYPVALVDSEGGFVGAAALPTTFTVQVVSK